MTAGNQSETTVIKITKVVQSKYVFNYRVNKRNKKDGAHLSNRSYFHLKKRLSGSHKFNACKFLSSARLSATVHLSQGRGSKLVNTRSYKVRILQAQKRNCKFLKSWSLLQERFNILLHLRENCQRKNLKIYRRKFPMRINILFSNFTKKICSVICF